MEIPKPNDIVPPAEKESLRRNQRRLYLARFGDPTDVENYIQTVIPRTTLVEYRKHSERSFYINAPENVKEYFSLLESEPGAALRTTFAIATTATTPFELANSLQVVEHLKSYIVDYGKQGSLDGFLAQASDAITPSVPAEKLLKMFDKANSEVGSFKDSWVPIRNFMSRASSQEPDVTKYIMEVYLALALGNKQNARLRQTLLSWVPPFAEDRQTIKASSLLPFCERDASVWDSMDIRWVDPSITPELAGSIQDAEAFKRVATEEENRRLKNENITLRAKLAQYEDGRAKGKGRQSHNREQERETTRPTKPPEDLLVLFGIDKLPSAEQTRILRELQMVVHPDVHTNRTPETKQVLEALSKSLNRIRETLLEEK